MAEQGGNELADHELQLHTELTQRCPELPAKHPGFAYSLPPHQEPNHMYYAAFCTQ